MDITDNSIESPQELPVDFKTHLAEIVAAANNSPTAILGGLCRYYIDRYDDERDEIHSGHSPNQHRAKAAEFFFKAYLAKVACSIIILPELLTNIASNKITQLKQPYE